MENSGSNKDWDILVIYSHISQNMNLPPSHPSCIISAASATRAKGVNLSMFGGSWKVRDTPGVAIPPAAKLTTGRRLSLAVSFKRWKGAWISFANTYNSSSVMTLAFLICDMTARWWRTASITLPVPASPFVRIIAAPSEMRRRASPRSLAPHTNGTLKPCLLMWYSSSAGVSTSDSSI